MVKYYNYYINLETNSKLDPKVLDYIIEEINNFINYYKKEKVKFKENNLRDIIIITSKIFNLFKELTFFKYQ